MLIRQQPRYSNKFKCLLILTTMICFIFLIYYIIETYIGIYLVLKIIKTVIHAVISSITNCRPYIAADQRSFYERDYPQENLPQRLSNSSYENVLRQLGSLRLVVLSCGRNVEHDINRFRRHVESILDLFHSSSSVHVFESDSNDKTVEKLRQWSRAQVYAYGNLVSTYPERTERLAYCRNTLLEKAHALKADYILMADLDRFSTTISSFLTNFHYDTNDWSVMTATTSDSYFDIWALRSLSNTVVNYDVWHRGWDLEISWKNYCRESVFDQIIGIHKKPIPIQRGLIEVRSAFGGAGLYKANATYKCQYNGARTTCEHVPFNLCIRKMYQGRIFINPAFQVS
ncbi:hypothetical protein I4U23_004021 [Adineta vaga]|nr:hypothetical protein I4U23_004021 [Adineta vaga]